MAWSFIRRALWLTCYSLIEKNIWMRPGRIKAFKWTIAHVIENVLRVEIRAGLA